MTAIDPVVVESTTPVGSRLVVGLTGDESDDPVMSSALDLAHRLDAALLGVHVRPMDGLTSRAGPRLERHRRSIIDRGGTYHEVVGDDVADALARFCTVERAAHLVIGAPPPEARRRAGSVAESVVRRGIAGDLHLVAPSRPSSPRSRRATPTTSIRRAPSIPLRRRAAAWVLVLVGLPALDLVLSRFRSHVSLSTSVLLDLSVVLAAAGVGGLAPGLGASVVALALVNWYFVPPLHEVHIADVENVVTLVIFVTVASVVSALASRTARRSREALRARAEAAALANTCAAMVGSSAPLHDVLAHLRSTFALSSASVLERRDGAWAVVHGVGDDPPRRPATGTARPLDPAGDVLLVLGPPAVPADGLLVLNAFIDQLAVVREASRLREHTEQLEAVDRTNALRSALLQSVSHDLRTPLASIKASASGLLRSDVDFTAVDRLRLLRSIDRSADRLDRMVGNVLDMSRIQAGRLDLSTRPTALEDVVGSAIATLPSDDRVEVDLPDLLPLVSVDATLLERSIANVISNAIAWSPAGSPIRICAETGDGRVALRVVDHGPGIPAEFRESVFEPFQRSGDRSGDAGVGLGLAIARGFTVAMGGTLVIGETDGGGSTVTFRLPTATVRS